MKKIFRDLSPHPTRLPALILQQHNDNYYRNILLSKNITIFAFSLAIHENNTSQLL